MYFSSPDDQFRILLKLSLIALYILLAYDLAIIVAGYAAIQVDAVQPTPSSTIIRNALFLVAIGELIATYLVKRSMLRNIKERNFGDEPAPVIIPYTALLRITVVVAVMCSAISTYGLVLVLLGERLEMLLLFVVLSLIGYQFFRLRPRDFKEDA